MEFSFTEEQLMIRDSAAAYLADKSTSQAVRAAMVSDSGYDAELWREICSDMFWHAIHIPEQYGGLGLGFVELVALSEQMGRFLLCAPYFSTVGLAVNALLVAGTEAQKAQFLGQIAAGKTAALAYNGGDRDSTAAAVAARYQRVDNGFRLNGEYHYVVDGHSADLLLLAAREEGSAGLSLFVLDVAALDAAGALERTLTPTMDQTRKLARIVCNDLLLPADALMLFDNAAEAALDKTLDLARIVLAAEQMGGTQAVLDQAVAYTGEREQFGRSIASFQAVKHKAADMMLKAEVSRSAVYYAACVAQEAVFGDAEGVGAELAEAAAMTKAYCSDSYFHNAGSNLQLHGGVGFTWEYDVHLYFKRARASETMLGNGAWHREQIAAALLDQR